MTAGQLELPLLELREPCQTFSAGQRCRYYTGHDCDHTFGGGLGDPVQLRRCGEPAQHPAHAWPDGEYACSGRRRD